MQKIFKYILIIFTITWGFNVSAAEELPSEVIKTHTKKIETRHYDKIVYAEYSVKDDSKKATNGGFRALFKYISGENKVKGTDEGFKIKMTKPVVITEGPEGEAVSMQFFMPAEYQLADLPIPNNENIILKEMKDVSFIVMNYSGSKSDKNIAKHEKELREYIKENNISTKSDATLYAFYNAPWTPSFARRNEILIELPTTK